VPPASARPAARRPSTRSGATATATAAGGAASAAGARGAARDGAATAREIASGDRREIPEAPRIWRGAQEKQRTSHEAGFGGVLKAANPNPNSNT